MEREYYDKRARRMTQEEVYLLPAEKLAERSGIPLHICPDTDRLYDAIAELMVEAITEKAGEKITMILPVGPVGQYPVFARKVRERKLSLRNLWTFNMDEFL